MTQDQNLGFSPRKKISDFQIYLKYVPLKSINELNIPNPNTIEQIYIRKCGLESMRGLENFPNVKVLDLSENTINRIECISDFKFLNRLELSENSLTKIENMSNLILLMSLRLDHCEIDEISGLDRLNISELYLSSNKIQKIQGLDSCGKLTHLDLTDNLITKIEGLEKSLELRNLWLKGNKIKNIEGLEFLSNIQKISIDGLPNIERVISSIKESNAFNSLLRLICLVKTDSFDKVLDADTILTRLPLGFLMLKEYLKEKDRMWFLQQAGPKLTGFISNLLENPKYQSVIGQDAETWKYIRDRSKEYHKN